MGKRKIGFISIFMILMFLFAFFRNTVYATKVTEDSQKHYVGITELMTNDEPNMGYGIGNPKANNSSGTAAVIWNLVEYASEADDAGLKSTGNKNIYCLKAGVGFSNTNKRATYDVFFDMKNEKEEIAAFNGLLEDLVNEKSFELADGTTVSRYDALLALADMLFLVDDSDEETYTAKKNEYLRKAGIYVEYWDTSLTRDDIKAVQQAAIWYFTNYGEENNKYDKTSPATGWLTYILDPKDDYTSLSDYRTAEIYDEGEQRQEQAEILYNYLIETAKENAKNISEDSGQGVTIKDTNLQYEKSGTDCIIGPIEITEVSGNSLDYTIDIIVKNMGVEIKDYTLLDESKEELPPTTKISELVGSKFYIKIPSVTITTEQLKQADVNGDGLINNKDAEIIIQKDGGMDPGYYIEGTGDVDGNGEVNYADATKILQYIRDYGINIDINVKYETKVFELWIASSEELKAAENTDEQPILMPTTQEQELNIPIGVVPVEKDFDLSLRKYITSVGGTTLSGTSSRVPNIDTSTLTSGTTATYKHKKDPIEVKTNDEVIYNITIYNEGEKDGRATKVIDQLPTGLEFVEVVSGNFVSSSYDTSSNMLTLTRTSGNTTNLAGYTGSGNLASETIQIKCKVTATAGATDKVLTNLAWIAEEVDGVTGETITTQTGKDRDSEPSTITTQSKDQLVTENTGYIGNSSNSGKTLNSQNSYFEGQQDDDDFEKIIIKKTEGRYNIQLIKTDDTTSAKRLEGAKFDITLPDGSKLENQTTNANGLIEISGIEISSEGTDTITITETAAPTGYNKLIDTIKVEITKTLSSGNYTISGVKLADGQDSISQYVTMQTQNNLVTITVKNKEKTLDLSLRKYITSVGGTTLSGTSSRVPNIDTSTLTSGTTATYKHKKDPIEVKTGDEVIYNITVYNEGEKDGRATKIVDQLPTGLKFVEVVSGNFEATSYSETDNTLTLTRKSGNTTNLSGYSGTGNLASETIQIKCQVTVTAGATDKVLTNLAWIAEEIDGVTGETITTQTGKDRDSEPGTITTLDKDQLVTEDTGYIGNSSNSGKTLNSQDSYFEGQQDDDDFEKIIIKKAQGIYNIKLTKKDSKDASKLLNGAKFEVTIPNNGTKTVETTGSGTVSISGIEIKEEGTEVITIKETEAPKGYNKIIDTIKIQITKEMSEENYIVTDAKLVDSSNQETTLNGAEVSIEGTNTVAISIENEEQIFDLSLRKYITAAGENSLEDGSSRAPAIDVSTLTTGTTATYKHRKDPVEVSTGDEVIYNITIYNEGEKEGRATKVIDQLPTGLKFLEVVSGNFEETSYSETNNILTLTRKAGNTTNLAGYSGSGNLASETIQIKCQVTATAGETEKVLTNLAWIAEEVDGVTGETITTQTGKDRDSEPSTITTLDKDQLVTEDSGYRGNESNNGKDLIDSNNYFEGQQDDDDFEKIVIKPATGDYNIQLIKTDSTNANTKLQGAVFEITLPNGNKLENQTTNENGIIEINGIEMTQIGTDTITIKEISAPTGYVKIIDSITLIVRKEIVNGNYVATIESVTNTVDGTPLDGIVTATKEGTTIKLDIKNKKIEGDYGLQIVKVDSKNNKVLQGAVFEVKLSDGTTQELTTNGDGIIEINNIAITNTTTENITIKEITPPKGYELLVPEMSLQVQKTVQGDKYVISNISLDPTNQYANAILQDGKIIITVKNEKIPADFKLIKRIVAVNNQNVPERIESIDASKLNTLDEEGKLITTADYQLSKDPVRVKRGDIVTYTIRVYNEGMVDGYVQEITEDIPEGLELVWAEGEIQDIENNSELTEAEKEAIIFNKNYLWGNFQYDENGKIIMASTNYLSKENEGEESNLIKAFGSNDGTKTEADLDYREVSIKMKVVSDELVETIIRNEACVTEDADENGEEIDDRDSKPEEWVKYEDDEDYDNIILQNFDLALRKFIVAVSKDETVEESEYLKNEDGTYKREPIVDTSLLNTTDENGNLITTAIYNHTKEPVLVQKNDYVIYMLRAYNEGDIDGYAAEIKDHLPPYLEYVDSEFNKQYGWEVSEDGRTVTTRYLENSLINRAEKNENGEYELSYVEVPIMCKVSENAVTSQNITNIADITEYQDENKEPTEDRDSEEDNVELPNDENLPGYKDDETGEYIPGQQDDDDFEKIIVKEFDLSLRKWVTQAIVTDSNGQTTITETGHQPYDDPEDVVKVELYRKNINDVIVKFRYSIRVTNEGEIEGYAKEVTDYIPEGLKFLAEDNPGWTDEGNNVISTRLLENTLLQPGEYAEVEVVLTWINSGDNMGVMNNIAEISEDYNDYGVPDKDSTPDNEKNGEDDIDDAPVMLSISTGRAKLYIGLCLTILITIAGGTFLIKKYVL